MAVNQTTIATAISKLGCSNQDKKALTALFNAITDDRDAHLAQYNALLAKIDAAAIGALGTNNVATLAVLKTGLAVKK